MNKNQMERLNSLKVSPLSLLFALGLGMSGCDNMEGLEDDIWNEQPTGHPKSKNSPQTEFPAKENCLLDQAPLCGIEGKEFLESAGTLLSNGDMDYEQWRSSPCQIKELYRLRDAIGDESEIVFGLAIDDVNKQVIVVIDIEAWEDHSNRIRAKLAEKRIGLNISIRPSCNSLRKTRSVFERLKKDDEKSPLRYSTRSIYVSAEEGKVVLTINPDSLSNCQASREKIDRYLDELQADGFVEVVLDQHVSQQARLSDTSPHRGAAAVGTFSGSTGACTSGFTVRYGNRTGVVSAGHCFYQGQTVWSGNVSYGTVVKRAPFPTQDLLLIESLSQESFIKAFYTDPGSPSQRIQTKKRSSVTVGDKVCLSGKVSLAKCGSSVYSVNCSLCDPSGCTHGLTCAAHPRLNVSTSGDSGAPVYQRLPNSGARICGMNIGSPGGNNRHFAFHTVAQIESFVGGQVAL